MSKCADCVLATPDPCCPAELKFFYNIVNIQIPQKSIQLNNAIIVPSTNYYVKLIPINNEIKVAWPLYNILIDLLKLITEIGTFVQFTATLNILTEKPVIDPLSSNPVQTAALPNIICLCDNLLTISVTYKILLNTVAGTVEIFYPDGTSIIYGIGFNTTTNQLKIEFFVTDPSTHMLLHISNIGLFLSFIPSCEREKNNIYIITNLLPPTPTNLPSY
ncbi:MAG: hypothetical protein Harvfovirus16_12 [Harvfovirus sp.]|uniref:Uncharacterized protein n=1 Tax=Harvfovirus sp. TaxID=2487768 RepID=A0A3G5A4G5_9VIRU|nr:MAG: hypothetical protein Harvfovirus16_12 [Harvfovirus sp.]